MQGSPELKRPVLLKLTDGEGETAAGDPLHTHPHRLQQYPPPSAHLWVLYHRSASALFFMFMEKLDIWAIDTKPTLQ